MIILFDILQRLKIDVLLEFLPEWQKPYFSDENFIRNKDQLIDYIISSRELIDSNIKIAILLLSFNKKEQVELLKLLNYKDTFTNLLIKLKDNELNTREFITIKKTLQIELDRVETVDEVEQFLEASNQRFFELLDYQVYVKEQLLTILNSENNINRVLVHMPTGTGKTKTSMHTIVAFFLNSMNKKGLIIWIAHTNTLLEQAEETFRNVWLKLGQNKINVYRLYDRHHDEINNESSGILFMGVQKMISIVKSNEVLTNNISRRARLVFFDEAHKSTAFSTKNAIQHIISYEKNVNKGLVGLTATPGRAVDDDFENLELVEFYNQKMISINPLIIEQLRVGQFKALNQELSRYSVIKYFQERKVLAKLRRIELEYDDSEIEGRLVSVRKNKNNDDLPPEVVRIFSENIKRNKIIIDKVIELVNENRQIILFACSVEHGKFLTAALRAQNIKASEVYGETTSIRRIDIIKRFRNNEINVLINCGVLTTGFDSTNINCVFITRPTSSIVLYSQMIGRGLRGPKMGGNEECLLLDMKDNLNRFSDDDKIFKYFNEYWG